MFKIHYDSRRSNTRIKWIGRDEVKSAEYYQIGAIKGDINAKPELSSRSMAVKSNAILIQELHSPFHADLIA